MSSILAIVLPILVGLAGIIFGVVHAKTTKAKADTAVAAANTDKANAQVVAETAKQQVADLQNAQAQTNQVAAQAGADASKERNNVDETLNAAPAAGDSGRDGLVSKWSTDEPTSGS